MIVELKEPFGTSEPSDIPAPKRKSVPKSKSKGVRLNLDSGPSLYAKWSADSGEAVIGDGANARGGSNGEAGDLQGWSEGVRYGQQMNLEFTNANLGYFETLHRKVDRVFDYPEDIARARIKGHVRIEAELSRDGRLLQILETHSSQTILNAYSLALLIHALRDPIAEKAWLETPTAIVVFEFDFRTHVEGSPTPDPIRIGVQKNNLAFARDASVETQPTETIREVFTHYVPPIIPVPGGFYIDFILAYEYVNNLTHDIPPERVQRARRLALLQQQLGTTVHPVRRR